MTQIVKYPLERLSKRELIETINGLVADRDSAETGWGEGPFTVEQFKSFCEETGREWRNYSNIHLYLEFAEWIRERQRAANPVEGAGELIAKVALMEFCKLQSLQVSDSVIRMVAKEAVAKTHPLRLMSDEVFMQRAAEENGCSVIAGGGGGSMDREQAIEIARRCARAKPQSYYAEPFQPHEWVIDAILTAARREPAESRGGGK